jgi:hypothetical protein
MNEETFKTNIAEDMAKICSHSCRRFNIFIVRVYQSNAVNVVLERNLAREI